MRRARPTRLLIVALVLMPVGLLAGVAVAGLATVQYLMGALAPITEFNPAIEHRFVLDNPDRTHTVYAMVDHYRGQASDTQLDLRTEDGTPVELTPNETYTSLFGRYRRALADFNPGGQTAFVIRAESADPNSRYIVSRSAVEASRRIGVWALPVVLSLGLVFLAGVIALIVYFASAPDPLDSPLLDPASRS